MATTVWVKSVHGLANKFDPARIAFDPKAGISYVSEAYNVDFDITGNISRRLGFESTDITGSCHSFFFGGNYCVFVVGDALSLLGEDMTSRALRAVTVDKFMSYTQIGDSVLYMNGSEKGVVKDGISWDYEKPAETRYPDGDRVYSDPPIGSIVRAYSGRVYIAEGNTLWYSEPFGPNLFRKATGYIKMPGRIVMIAPVLSGMFVSTEFKIYFLTGTNPKEFIQHTLTQYPAIEGTDVEVDGISLKGGEISPFPCQMFTTREGICVRTSEGKLVNLTYDTLEYPNAKRGSAVYTGSKYIVSLEA